jgi:hypothetical protein
MKVKKIILVLLAILFICPVVYSQDIPFERDISEMLIPYEINHEKTIDVPDAMKITYVNVWIEQDKAKISGTVTVNLEYDIIELFIDYYVFNKKGDYLRAMPLELVKGAMPNTFTFEQEYPLDLTMYEAEIFIIDFMNQKKPNMHI